MEALCDGGGFDQVAPAHGAGDVAVKLSDQVPPLRGHLQKMVRGQEVKNSTQLVAMEMVPCRHIEAVDASSSRPTRSRPPKRHRAMEGKKIILCIFSNFNTVCMCV